MDSGAISIGEVVTSGDKNGLRLLLERGADVNQTNKGGQTPLILAVVSGQVRLLPLLLEAGADPLLRDGKGLNAVEWAERKGLLDIARQLRERTTSGAAKNQTRELSATQEKVVQEKATPLPPPEVSDKNLLDVEKSKRWIAGIKQRLDEKASRLQSADVDYSTEGERPSDGEPPELQTSSPSETLPENPVSSKQDSRLKDGSLTKSTTRAASRKKCPQCNAVYDDDLVAYCAFHVVPLVDINAPAPVPEDESRKNVILWLMVIITFLAAALIGLILFLPRGNPNDQGTGASSKPTPIPTWKGTPVADGSLKSKIVDLPAAQTVLKIEKSATVIVRVKIDNTGQVSSVQSSSGNEELKRAAMDAARKATFSSDKLRGRETAGTITYTFNP